MQALPKTKPSIARWRAILALVIAAGADAVQFALVPVSILPFDEIIDVVVMLATTLLLGFHPLLLPTFVIEVVPIADMLPTWTGCVATVIWLRKRKSQPV